MWITVLQVIFGMVVLLALVLLLAGQMGWLRGKVPTQLGVGQGRLMPPNATPNSVSSQAGLFPEHKQRRYAQIEPLRFSGDADRAFTRVANALAALPDTQIIQRTPEYVYAQCTTQWLKFTDDVELYLDRQAGVIQVRSASRLGQKDFGVNRARVEALRSALKDVPV
ncbi:MAG: DUF1499 domain-containing protein [Variovorax sp.]